MRFISSFPKIGRLIKLFVVSDLILLSGWGLIQPIFAVFVVESIAEATVITVGINAAIYWILKGVFQLPVAFAIDKIEGEKDNFVVLVMGLTLTGLSAFSFAFVNQIWQLYLVQAVHALGMAMYSPSWSSIFSSHLDEGHRALDWSLDNASLSLAAGFAGILSGYFVLWFGFPTIFIITAILSLTSAFIILITPKLIFPPMPAKTHKNDKSTYIRRIK